MENASKALIIAGAILLAILLISLGIMIYNQAAGVVDTNAMSEVEISTFNQKFEQYFGTNVRGNTVNSLITAVNNNNSTQSDTSRKVSIIGNSVTEAKATNYKSEYEKGSTYTVKVVNTTMQDPAPDQAATTYGYTSAGLIQTISITKNP